MSRVSFGFGREVWLVWVESAGFRSILDGVHFTTKEAALDYAEERMIFMNGGRMGVSRFDFSGRSVLLRSEDRRSRIDAFRRRDHRVRCLSCRRWMRRRPKEGSGYAVRRPAPNAGRCQDCPIPFGRGEGVG